MRVENKLGGLSAAAREKIYTRVGMNADSITQVERMIAGSGARDVGKSALTNVRVCLQSAKNRAPRVVESHTCELVYAYELELDPSVLGYYVQVPCQQIKRTTTSGRNHISSAHLDFLVFRENRIELIECKKLAWLMNESKKPGTHWMGAADSWLYPPYFDWAERVGLTYRTWVPPEPTGVYLQNLEACYAIHRVELAPAERLAIDQARKLLDRCPASIEEMVSAIPGFTPRQALWMLASRQAYGPLVSTPIALLANFHLYACETQAQEVDATVLRARSRALSDANVNDPLVTASSTDRDRAIKAYAELREAQSGIAPLTKRLKRLARQVETAIAGGLSPLAGCLTKYANSGNHSSRLLPEQEQAVEAALLMWERGKVRLVKHLHYAFEAECRARGVDPIGKGRLDALRVASDPRRRALATGGFRGYHKVRPATDPRFRSLPPIGFGQVLHVDSSSFDLRYAVDPSDGIRPPKATFYVGIDGCSRMPMAHSLIFGPSRTDGLALLVREYVKQHGFLPRMIHLDRGSENRSSWFEEFCDEQCDFRYSPTAASAWNGIAEARIKLVNGQVAHDLPGNTLPDQYGRSIDGRFKSIHNARMAFAKANELLVHFLYEDLPQTPGDDGLSPNEARDAALEMFGVMGVPCEWNDDFMIRTSIRPRRWSVDRQRGVRVDATWFVSEQLSAALWKHDLEDVRMDCCDPTICHVKIGAEMVKCFRSDVQKIACLSDEEKLFELLWRPIERTAAKRRRMDLDRARYNRHQLAVASLPATQHLAPASEPALEQTPESTEVRVEIDFDSLDPLDEREDF